MGQITIDVFDNGKAPDGDGNMIGINVSIDVKDDPTWLSGVTKVVKQAVDTLLEQTVGLKKEDNGNGKN